MARRRTTTRDDRGNPPYPTLTGLDRYRNDPNADRYEYGRAVLAAMRALNARALTRAKPHPCPCASGVWDSDGEAILAAVGRQNGRR
jgi:hypothetical protein